MTLQTFIIGKDYFEPTEELQKQLQAEMNEWQVSFEAKLKALDKKHEAEIARWFNVQKYPFGIIGWLKFGTNDYKQIIKKIKFNDIIESSFKKKSKKNVRKIVVQPYNELQL